MPLLCLLFRKEIPDEARVLISRKEIPDEAFCSDTGEALDALLGECDTHAAAVAEAVEATLHG